MDIPQWAEVENQICGADVLMWCQLTRYLASLLHGPLLVTLRRGKLTFPLSGVLHPATLQFVSTVCWFCYNSKILITNRCKSQLCMQDA